MASSSYPKKDDLFEANKPHFLKIVLADTIRDKKLVFPRKFVRKYGNNLPSSIVLTVPSCAKWQVELIKSDGEIWLQNGWQEFVEYYALTVGSLLVFEYDERNCRFNVIIFDKSALEINYPYTVNVENEGKGTNNPEEAKYDVSYESLDEVLPSRKIMEESPSPLPNPHKNMKLENLTLPETCKKMKLENPTRKNEAKRGSCGEKQKFIWRTQPLTKNYKANALHRARTAFKSKNPFFMVVMQPSYVHAGNKMWIPERFARRYLKIKRGDVILIVMGGRTWSIIYHCNNKTKLNPRLCAKMQAAPITR
ncbi:B3 domain-containing transcription factor VRN1 [Jatropha curcas]|uniref:B3 domain-containing transcription factor VRN1 n=1 Tax=Jatropha curcas TaxID=180498 RepID=UPI0009D6B896|nr:B3 domain-containing transcription factor VRN1 [Jatropha curcas]